MPPRSAATNQSRDLIMTNKYRHLLFAILLLPVLSLHAEPARGAFSQQLFADVLAAHVNQGVVDYPAISQDERYYRYLDQLKTVTELPSTSEKLAYWINAYNALAIQGILDGRSPESFFGKIGYFYNAEYQVNGHDTNLYDLEHDIIIPLDEPRIHFALNCASASCPILRNKPYVVSTLEQQLENAATEFINDTSRNRFDYSNRIAYLSKIFDWFEDDFSKHSGSVQNYLALYIADRKIADALANNEFTIEYMDYDWSLNGIAPKTKSASEE